MGCRRLGSLPYYGQYKQIKTTPPSKSALFNLRLNHLPGNLIEAIIAPLPYPWSTTPMSPSSPEQDFASFRTWAVVGVSADQTKYGNIIFRRLLAANYTVYPIHPKLTTVEGHPCFASLADLPVKPDVVNVVVPPFAAMGVVQACIELGITRLWFQPGSEEPQAIATAEAAGITVLANACILLTHQTW
jgi:uncharacterized protein